MDMYDDDTLSMEEVDELIGMDELKAHLHMDKAEEVNTISNIVQWGNDKHFDKMKHSTPGFISNIVEELAELKEATQKGDWTGQVDAINDIMVFCMTELPKLQIHPKYSLVEVHKVINSRVGDWSEEDQKWVKDKSPEAQSNWHEPDYEQYKGKK